VIVLGGAHPILERLPENDDSVSNEDRFKTGQGAYKMPDHGDVYDSIDVDHERLYG